MGGRFSFALGRTRIWSEKYVRCYGRTNTFEPRMTAPCRSPRNGSTAIWLTRTAFGVNA